MYYSRRLGIELAKTLSLNYSNQETSVTVGESVRDEDGIPPFTHPLHSLGKKTNPSIPQSS